MAKSFWHPQPPAVSEEGGLDPVALVLLCRVPISEQHLLAKNASLSIKLPLLLVALRGTKSHLPTLHPHPLHLGVQPLRAQLL
jgi:hypothetical protein